MKLIAEQVLQLLQTDRYVYKDRSFCRSTDA